MAKFKVGDKVTDGNGVFRITGIDKDFGSYEWKLVSGSADPSHSTGGNFNWADVHMKIANSRACNSSNPVVRNAMNGCAATNAKLESGAFLKEFVSYAKGALGDIQRQCNESLASIKAKGKEMQSRSEKDGFSVEWSAIVNKGVVFVGVVKEILRDIDHAISRY